MYTASSSTPKVFLSSTYDDLKDYRKEIIEAVGRLKYLSLDMEHSGARAESKLEASRQGVRESTIFVGIIGNRYGSVYPGTAFSVSEHEYNLAVELRIPQLMFLPDPENPPTTLGEHDDNEQRRLQFIEKVRRTSDTSNVYKLYSNPYELPALVATSLANFVANRDATDGSNELSQRRFSSAIHYLERANDLHPNSGRIAFNYALALLQGRRPSSFRERGDIIQIEELLKLAMLALKRREVIAFWGALKEDYWFKRWGYEEEHEDALDLFKRARDYASDPKLLALLNKVQPDIMSTYEKQFN